VSNRSDIAEDLALLTGAAAEAGRIAMRYFRKNPKVSWKGGVSPVTEADLQVDTFLRETLMAARPGYGWLSEETEDNPARLLRKRTFVVDPIDGTKAFIDGREVWCVSAAVVENGRSLCGVLHCPAKGEVFSASVRGGAAMNGTRLTVAEPSHELKISGPKHFVVPFANAEARRVEAVGHVPSLAYRIALIAAGRISATFVKPNAHDWDIAAADLILAEAGGTLVRADGMRPHYAGETVSHGVLAAGHPSLIAGMLGVVAASTIG
jgi:myo-inositol-1(or 4)-monophosphatase